MIIVKKFPSLWALSSPSTALLYHLYPSLTVCVSDSNRIYVNYVNNRVFSDVVRFIIFTMRLRNTMLKFNEDYVNNQCIHIYYQQYFFYNNHTAMTTKPLVPRKPSTLQCKQKRPPVPKKPIKLTSTDITTSTDTVTNTRPAKPTIPTKPTKPKIQLSHKQPPPTPKKSLNAIWAVAAQRITHRHTSPISTFPYNNTNTYTNINTNTKPIASKPKQEIQRSNTTPSNISHLTKTRSRGPKRRLPTKV